MSVNFVQAERRVEALEKQLEACLLEFQAACIMEDTSQQSALRFRAHDLTDLFFDAQADYQRCMNDITGDPDGEED